MNASSTLTRSETHELPAEFILKLGPNSTIHVAAMARLLEDLGARVEIDPKGALVAVRPEA